MKRPLLVLFGAVALVLALACANVTNLFLVRMTIRSKEVAVRAALGAQRLRLVRQFLAESLLLSFAGGAAGLAAGWWGLRQLIDLIRTSIPRAADVSLDWRVFLFLLAVCTVTAAVSGLLPALFAMRADGAAALHVSSGRATMSAGQRRVRDGLVVAEVALAFVLTVAAATLVRELVRLRRTDSGMVTTNVLTLHLGHRSTPQSDVHRFYDIADRVAGLPGVRAAGFTQLLPLQNWGWTSNSNQFTAPGRPASTGSVFSIEMRYVTPGYFRALGIPVRGRGLSDRDVADAPRVIVINDTLARRIFGTDDPVGVATSRGTIVGLAGDVREAHLDSPAMPVIYFPMAQNWSQLSELGMSLVVSTGAAPERLTDAIRSIVRDVDPNLAVFDVKSMDRVVADSLSAFTLFLWLMTAFAAISLLLALTGTYGVISYIASSRVREFAIRVALGADPGQVTRLVLGRGLLLTATGLVAGLAAALAAGPLLQGLPMTMGRPDIVTLAPVAAFVGLISLVACLIPARRAAKVQPMAMLRSE